MRLNRATLIALATVAISSTAFAQAVQEAATNYQVPTFETKTLDVHGGDLFSYDKAAAPDADATMTFHLGSDFGMWSQSPEKLFYVTNDLDISGGKAGDADLTWGVDDVITGGYHMWLMGSRGVRVGGDVVIGIGLDSDDGSGEMGKNIAFAAKVGAGYGRVIDARTIAVAAAMYEAVGKTASAADLAKAAEIMGQYAAGAYDAKYKDPTAAASAYYADLGAAVGTDNPFKLAEVENSPIYNIGSRKAGYHFDVDFGVASGDHGVEGGDGQSMSVVQSAGYAMLLADNMGLSIEETLWYGLDDNEAQLTAAGIDALVGHPGKSNMLVNIDIDWNLDHSSQWSSSAHVDFDLFKQKDLDDMGMAWGLHAETNYALGTKATAYANLHVIGGNDNSERGGEIGYGFAVGFRYFIF